MPCGGSSVESNMSLLLPQTLCAIAPAHLKAGHHWWSKGFFGYFGDCFPFGSMQDNFLQQRHQHIVVKALCRPRLNFSILSELCRCCFQQWGLAVSLWRTIYSLGHSLGCLGVSMWHLRPTAQLYVTQSWYWKLYLVTKDDQEGLCHLHFLAILFR